MDRRMFKVLLGFILSQLLLIGSVVLIVIASLTAFTAVCELNIVKIYQTIGFVGLTTIEVVLARWIEDKVEKYERKLKRRKRV